MATPLPSMVTALAAQQQARALQEIAHVPTSPITEPLPVPSSVLPLAPFVILALCLAACACSVVGLFDRD